MKKTRFIACFAIGILFIFSNHAVADIYRYKDDKGVWHFTNIRSDKRYKVYIKSYPEKPAAFIKKYNSIINQASERFSLDPSLIKAVIKAESDFDYKATSKKGAQGLMQLMPKTADEMRVADPYNPEENIFGGARYLSLLLERFQNNMTLALAAYNAGPEKVEVHNGVPPYSETRTFIKRVLNFYQEYLVIGHSVEGRPLEVFRFGKGPRDLMIVAGIHGGYEWNTIALADELIEYLYFHPDQIPPLLSIHILRSLNPDGAILKGNPWGRGNAYRVDLNRNWDSSWSADVPKPNCWDLVPLTAGPHPGSEPETQALLQYFLDANIEALISYHSAGLGIFAGGKPSTAESLSLAEAVAEVSDYPYPPIDIGCEYTGTMTDWAADNGIAAIDVELSTHWDTDFEQNLVILQTFLDWRPE